MNDTERIFVLEDEPDIVEIVRYHLEREQYAVLTASNGEAGLEAIRDTSPSLVVLDLLLPGLDGLEVCRRLKLDPATQDIPIIMVTAKGEESDVVLGLGLGADDYVTKPFSPKELAARVKAVLRRAARQPAAAAEDKIVRGSLQIDASAYKVRVDGRAVPMTATEFRLLHFLAANPGRVFTRDQLIDSAIGDGVAVIDRNIDVHVRALRKKLGRHRDLIETVRGVGYRFAEERAEE